MGIRIWHIKFGKKNMIYKIGVFGSAAGKIETEVKENAKELGKTLNNYQVGIITGACSGLPYLIAFEASKKGNSVWGYSPKPDLNGQKEFTPKDDLSIYKKLIFISKNFEFVSNDLVSKKYRNVISTANCDAGIIISGRWGTMNEFTNLYDMGKVIGILTKTGGIADELPRLIKKISKKSKSKIFFSSSPKELVGMIIKELKLRQV